MGDRRKGRFSIGHDFFPRILRDPPLLFFLQRTLFRVPFRVYALGLNLFRARLRSTLKTSSSTPLSSTFPLPAYFISLTRCAAFSPHESIFPQRFQPRLSSLQPTLASREWEFAQLSPSVSRQAFRMSSPSAALRCPTAPLGVSRDFLVRP